MVGANTVNYNSRVVNNFRPRAQLWCARSFRGSLAREAGMVFRAAQWERKANVILYRQITWTRALVPVVEWVAQALWNSGGKTLGKIPTLPTRLTQRRTPAN